jgi:hypothetical protein
MSVMQGKSGQRTERKKSQENSRLAGRDSSGQRGKAGIFIADDCGMLIAVERSPLKKLKVENGSNH